MCASDMKVTSPAVRWAVVAATSGGQTIAAVRIAVRVSVARSWIADSAHAYFIAETNMRARSFGGSEGSAMYRAGVDGSATSIMK